MYDSNNCNHFFLKSLYFAYQTQCRLRGDEASGSASRQIAESNVNWVDGMPLADSAYANVVIVY